jgi:hypothetical protein
LNEVTRCAGGWSLGEQASRRRNLPGFYSILAKSNGFELRDDQGPDMVPPHRILHPRQRWTGACLVAICTLLPGLLSGRALPQDRDPPSPEERAIAFLAREVPKWPREHRCFSCHNNGDAARALFTAKRLGYTLPGDALGDTTQWLLRPADWLKSAGNEEFKDERLAVLQFSLGLATAIESSRPGEAKNRTDAAPNADRAALQQAARLLAAQQQPDGAWLLETGSLGSPATYGRTLGTAAALSVLRRADAAEHRKEIAAGERWITSREPKSVVDAAALLWALADIAAAPASQKEMCIAVFRQGESSSGGWGPYVTSPPETFDTALVVLALVKADRPRGSSTASPTNQKEQEIRDMLSRGRKFLIDEQLADGGWTETTRPRGAESYAQRLSTSGWCALALLETQEFVPR